MEDTRIALAISVVLIAFLAGCGNGDEKLILIRTKGIEVVSVEAEPYGDTPQESGYRYYMTVKNSGTTSGEVLEWTWRNITTGETYMTNNTPKVDVIGTLGPGERVRVYIGATKGSNLLSFIPFEYQVIELIVKEESGEIYTVHWYNVTLV